MQCDSKGQDTEVIEIESDSGSENEDGGLEDDGKLRSDSNSQEDGDAKVQGFPDNGDEEDIIMQNVSDSEYEEDGKLKGVSDNEDEDGEAQNVSVNEDGQVQTVSEHVDVENVQSNSNHQEKQDHFNIEDGALFQEDVSPSLFGPEAVTTDVMAASLSATEEEVTKTLLSLNEASRKTITQSMPRDCSSSTNKVLKEFNPAQPYSVIPSSFPIQSHISYNPTSKFEGCDVKSEFVPTLHKIRQKHGNILENSIIRCGDIIARALESLATVVKILDDIPVQSLSPCQADYLISTLSDLRWLGFKVDWLSPFVEKAVQLHKSKPLVDSLNNLTQLSSQVKERKATVLDELAKLGEEEDKLNEEMAKVSKMIPFSGQVKFDERLGSGL